MAGENDCTIKTVENITDLEEAKMIIKRLQKRLQEQLNQYLLLYKNFKMQEDLLVNSLSEHTHNLRSLSFNFLIYESQVHRKQKKMDEWLVKNEIFIKKQYKVIETLHFRLMKAGVPCPDKKTIENFLIDESSLVLDEKESYKLKNATIERSFSDVQHQNTSKLLSLRRINSFLRRPKVPDYAAHISKDSKDFSKNKSPVGYSPPPFTRTPSPLAQNPFKSKVPYMPQLDTIDFKTKMDRNKTDRIPSCSTPTSSKASKLIKKTKSTESNLESAKLIPSPKSGMKKNCKILGKIDESSPFDLKKKTQGSLTPPVKERGRKRPTNLKLSVINTTKSVWFKEPEDMDYKAIINRNKSKSLEELRDELKTLVQTKSTLSLDYSA